MMLSKEEFHRTKGKGRPVVVWQSQIEEYVDLIETLAEALTEALGVQENWQDQRKFEVLREKGWLE